MHFTPAAWVVRQFGSNYKVARAVGRKACTIIRWKKRACGDCRGLIPSEAMPAILEAAVALGLDVQAADLILGRDLPDPVPTLAQMQPKRPEPVPERVPVPAARRSRRLP